MSSKVNKLDDYMRARVREAVDSLVADSLRSGDGNRASVLAAMRDDIATRTITRVVYDPYRRRQLYDIVDWKKPPKTPGD